MRPGGIELGLSSPRGRGPLRRRLIAGSLLALLATGAILYGPGALEYFLIETRRDSYPIPGVGMVHRVTRMHRLEDLPHGFQEEWYESGIQKSSERFDRGFLIESVHWSPEGHLDGWWLPEGGVRVIWVQSQEVGGEAWKEQARVSSSAGGGGVVVEFRVAEMRHARENTPGSSEGFFTPEEIIEIVRSYHSVAPGARAELAVPPIRAPRSVAESTARAP